MNYPASFSAGCFCIYLQLVYWVVSSAAVFGQPVDPQQPSSAQHGFGQGIGQGLSQTPSAFSPAQHGFGQHVVQGVAESSVDAICAAIIFGQDAIWAIIGQQPPDAWQATTGSSAALLFT
jgi:hypothetical protein